MPSVRISGIIATQEAVDAFRAVFACRRCGTCCTGFKGVKLNEDEVKRLDVPEAERDATFMFIDGAYYMKEPCRFYDAGKSECNIYNDRPETCRNFPLYNQRCDDDLVHLGVCDSCEAALDTLAEAEVEFLGR
jgi:Fe-S-cluster containining protein